MRYAIAIPQYVPDGTFDPWALRRYLIRAEDLGFHGAWAGEQLLGTMPHLSPIEVMTYAAACTDRIRIGCAAFVSTLHSPVQLAKSLSTLDQLSHGRLDIAITTGGRFRPFAAFGVEPDSFVSRFTEGLRLMKALWQNDRLDFDGEFWQLSDAAMEPKTYQKPHPPIWFGATAGASLHRAVRLGDGFIGAGSSTTGDFAGHVHIVRQALADQRRDPATFPIAKRIYIAVDDDATRARDRIAVALDELYGYFGLRGLAAVAVAGTPDDCVKGVRDVMDAGAEMILFNPMFDDAEQMERLAAEVIPRLG